MFLTYNGQTTPICQIPTAILKAKLATVDPSGIHFEYLTDELAWRDARPEYHK